MKKSELEYEKKITFSQDAFKNFVIPESLKEAEQKIRFSPYSVDNNVSFDKDVHAKMLKEDDFEDEEKVKPLSCFTSPVVVSKKVTFDKTFDEKKVKPLACLSSPFVVSSSFPQHSLFEGPSFSLGPEFEFDRETEDEKPVIKEISIRQNQSVM